MSAIEDALRPLVAAMIREELARRESAPVRLLSVRETCERLGISRTSLNLAMRRGDLVPVRVGRRVLFPESAIAALGGRG